MHPGLFMAVFISHDYKDGQFVDRLQRALRNCGVEVISINLRLTLGEDLMARIYAQMAYIDHVIAVMSENYLNDEWLERELQALLFLENRRNTEMIVPVVLDACKVPVLLRSRILDFRDRGKTDFQQIITRVLANKRVFVVMMMTNPQLESAYEGVIKPLFDRRGYTIQRAADLYGGEALSSQVLDAIQTSGLIVSDLTGERPNCYFEAGYALALRKQTVFTVYGDDIIHFDIAGHRFLRWKTEEQLRNGLTEWLDAIGSHAVAPVG
jgi:hypothetical protein